MVTDCWSGGQLGIIFPLSLFSFSSHIFPTEDYEASVFGFVHNDIISWASSSIRDEALFYIQQVATFSDFEIYAFIYKK